MKVKENVTVYECSFCKKRLFRKSAMINHELWCTSNPDNYKACSDCEHIEESKVSYEGISGHLRESVAFFCPILNKGVYPLIVEKKGLPEKYPETFEDQIPMPTKCSHYSCQF